LIFEICGRNPQTTMQRMYALEDGGEYQISFAEKQVLRQIFYSDYASEDSTVETMYDFFCETGYAMDTHTGVAMNVAKKYLRDMEDDIHHEAVPMIVVGTASPYKFPQAVYYALTGNDVKDSFKGVKRINLLTAMKVPDTIKALRDLPARFKTVVPPDRIFEEVKNFIV